MASVTVNVFENGGKQMLMRAQHYPIFHLASSPSHHVMWSQM